MPSSLRIVLSALPLTLIAVARPVRALSLHQALDLARRHSPEVQKAASVREEARWRKIESYSYFVPTITASANHLLDKKYMFTDINFKGDPVSFPNVVPSTIFGLSAEWGLFDGFAGTDRARSARRFESAAEQDYTWTSFKVAREVTLQYYRALAARSLKDVAESNLKTLQDHLRDVRLSKRSGVSTNYDVLRVEVQVSEAESELLNADDNIELTRSRLTELLGLDESDTPEGRLPDLTPDLIAKVGGEPPEERPDLAAMSEKVEGLDLQEHAASRHWVPRLSAFGSYDYYNNRNDDADDWGNFRNAYQVGLRLRWDLFDGLRSTAQAHEALEKKAQTESSLRAARLKAKQDLNLWTRKFKYYCSISKARQNDVGKAKESVRLARAGRRAGARTNTDLLDAEAELYRAQAGAVSARLGAVEALINVELSLGRPLYNFE